MIEVLGLPIETPALVFYAILGVVLYVHRDKLEVMEGIFFVYKWDEGVEYLKKIARPKWLWKVISTISIPICLLFMLVAVHTLYLGAVSILEAPDPQATVQVFIPGVRLSERQPRFTYALISLMIIIVFHEGFHGIIAAVEGIDLETTGVGLLLFLPLAFVEPVKESFEKSKLLSRIRMLCAGSFGNFTIGLIALIILLNIIAPIQESQVVYEGVNITSVLADKPAGLAGVPSGVKLLKIGNESVNNKTHFEQILSTYEPNDTMVLETTNGTYSVNLSSRPGNESLPYLGLFANNDWSYKKELTSNYPLWFLSIPSFLTTLFMWIYRLNFMVGVFNLFPLWITDGGKILMNLLSIFIKSEKVLLFIVNLIFSMCLGILLFNMFGPVFI